MLTVLGSSLRPIATQEDGDREFIAMRMKDFTATNQEISIEQTKHNDYTVVEDFSNGDEKREPHKLHIFLIVVVIEERAPGAPLHISRLRISPTTRGPNRTDRKGIKTK